MSRKLDKLRSPQFNHLENVNKLNYCCHEMAVSYSCAYAELSDLFFPTCEHTIFKDSMKHFLNLSSVLFTHLFSSQTPTSYKTEHTLLYLLTVLPLVTALHQVIYYDLSLLLLQCQILSGKIVPC